MSGVRLPSSPPKRKSRVSGFFFLFSSLFTLHSSLFSFFAPPRLFPVKREERKEKRIGSFASQSIDFIEYFRYNISTGSRTGRQWMTARRAFTPKAQALSGTPLVRADPDCWAFGRRRRLCSIIERASTRVVDRTAPDFRRSFFISLNCRFRFFHYILYVSPGPAQNTVHARSAGAKKGINIHKIANFSWQNPSRVLY